MSFQDLINSLTEDDLRRINEAFKQQKNKLPIYTYLFKNKRQRFKAFI